MKIYNVTKIEPNGTTKDYGRMSEADMKLITRGFKQDELIPNMYTRKGCTTFYIVDEVQ